MYLIKLCTFVGTLKNPSQLAREIQVPGQSGQMQGVLSTQSLYLACRAVSLQEEAEAVAGPLVVLQALPQATVVILHEAPVQNHLQLAWNLNRGRERKEKGESKRSSNLDRWPTSDTQGDLASTAAAAEAPTQTPCG